MRFKPNIVCKEVYLLQGNYRGVAVKGICDGKFCMESGKLLKQSALYDIISVRKFGLH